MRQLRRNLNVTHFPAPMDRLFHFHRRIRNQHHPESWNGEDERRTGSVVFKGGMKMENNEGDVCLDIQCTYLGFFDSFVGYIDEA